MSASSTSATRPRLRNLLRRLRPAHIAVLVLAVGALGGTAWGALAKGSVGTRQVVDNSLQGRDIRNGSIGAIDIAQGAVSSAKITNNTITASDVAIGGLTGSQVADRTIGTSDLALLSVGNAQLATDSVSGSKISSSAVGSTEITANAVGASELADLSVASLNIIDGAVATVDIANGAITTPKEGTLPAARLIAGATTVAPAPAAATVVHWGTEVVDTGTLFDPAVANNDRVTIPVTGLYSITANVQWTADTPPAGTRYVEIHRASGLSQSAIATVVRPASVSIDTDTVATLVQLVVGDTVSLLLQTPAASISNSSSASLTVAWAGNCAGTCTAG